MLLNEQPVLFSTVFDTETTVRILAWKDFWQMYFSSAKPDVKFELNSAAVQLK